MRHFCHAKWHSDKKISQYLTGPQTQELLTRQKTKHFLKALEMHTLPSSNFPHFSYSLFWDAPWPCLGYLGLLKALGLISFRDMCRETSCCKGFLLQRIQSAMCLEHAPVKIILQTSTYPHACTVWGAGRCGSKINMMPDWTLLAEMS